MGENHRPKVPRPSGMSKWWSIFEEPWVKLHDYISDYVEREIPKESGNALEDELKPGTRNGSVLWKDVGRLMRPTNPSKRSDEAERPFEPLPEILVRNRPRLAFPPEDLLGVGEEQEVEQHEEIRCDDASATLVLDRVGGANIVDVQESKDSV